MTHLFMFGTGIALFHRIDVDWKWGAAPYLLVIGAVITFAILWFLMHVFTDYYYLTLVCAPLLWLVAGIAAAGLQFIIHEPPQLMTGVMRAISGQIIKIDGKMDQRS